MKVKHIAQDSFIQYHGRVVVVVVVVKLKQQHRSTIQKRMLLEYLISSSRVKTSLRLTFIWSAEMFSFFRCVLVLREGLYKRQSC
jgi:hypothetical protein